MKLKLFLIIIYALTFNYLNAQDQNSSNFDFNKYIVDNVSNPRSPEANAMEKYGNIGVNYYNGKPDISIPLHSITGREFNVPISINYAVQGLIVDQVATNVGYGWNLNAGGRISVIKNGMADFNELSNLSIKNPAVRQQINQALIRHQQNEFNNSNEAIQHYNFIRDIAEGKTDGLYDLYSLNAIGINDYIVFDNNTFLPKALKNYRIKIEAFIVNNILTGWKVINDDGTEYYFGQHQPSGDESFEKTFITGDDSGANHYNGAQYISSWLLKKIISKTKKDTIIFNYKKLNWNKEYGLFDIAAQSYVYFSSPINQNPSPSTQYSFTPSYKTTQLFLENVYVNGELEMSLNYKSREDIIYENNSVADFTIKSALDKITFPSLGSKKEIVFHHTYFGYNNPTESIFTKYKNIRLKLDAIEISGIQDVEIEAIGNQNISQNYSFEYERPHLMPSIDFKSNDYNGIFNGTQNSSTLKDNNQRFNFNAATIGILKKINYPTGGYTEFEYEAETKKPLFSETWWEEQHIASASSPPATSPMYLCWSTMDGYFKGATNQFTLNESHFLITDEFLEYTPFQISSNSLTIINDVAVTYECTEWDGPFYMCEDVPGQGPPLDSDGNHIYCTPEQRAGNQSYCCLEQCINEITIETPLNLNQICGPPPGQHSNTYLSFYNNAVVPQQSNGILNLYRPGVFQISNFSHNTHDNTSSVLKREVKRKRHEYPSHIRIKKITDATPTEKTSRRFIYKMDLDSDESSAVILSNASFSKSKIVTKKAYSYSTGSSACEQNNQTIITYFSSNSNNNPYQDHVVYERVFEITESESGYNLGYTVYDFHTGESGVLQNSKAFHWDYDHKVGNLKSKKIFNRQQDITFEEEYIYENIQLSSNNNNHLYSYFGGLQTNYMDEYDATFPLLVKPINHSTFNLLLHPPDWGCFGGGCCPQPNNPLNNTNIVQNLQNQYSQILSIGDRGTLSFDTSPIGSSVSLGFNKKTITKEYFTNGVIENEVENNYDENQYYLLTETVQNNNGDTLRNVFYYPEEFSNHHFLNRLTDVVRSDSFKNDKLLGSKKYNYSMHSGNRLLLDRIDFKKEEQMEYEPRIYFLYDQLSNIIEVKNALNNPSFKTAYIWGYNNRFMVGEVKNALFSELPLNQVNTIKNITNSSNNANQFNTAFEQLRANMPNSFISSFYYDSQRNLRIMSDYKNDKVFYDFAPLGRLQFIKDKDGNILSQNQYNYKENN